MSENTTLKSLILTCLLIDHVDVSKCLPLLIFFFFDAILHSSLCLSSRNHAAANVLGDDGAFALVETVKVNTTLTTLDLSCLRHCFHCFGSTVNNANADNKIGLAGARALAEVLKFNTTLKTLDFSGESTLFQKGIDQNI